MGKKRPKSRTTKQPAHTVSEPSTGDSVDEMIAAAMIARPQTVLMKVCRLCETRDGPFLNIFDGDKITAKRIKELMPFVIEENDDLPHKICFRCSAKVEELHEFIQKCIKTQQNLQSAMGQRTAPIPKTTTRTLWEEKLNKTNLSNEDICNALIKKAMEGIKDIPINPPVQENPQPPLNKKVKAKTESQVTSKKDSEPTPVPIKNNLKFESDDEHEEINLKQVKLAIDKCDEKVVSLRSRSKKSEPVLEPQLANVEPPKKLKQYPVRRNQNRNELNSVEKVTEDSKESDDSMTSSVVSRVKDNDKEKPKEDPPKVQEPPPQPPPPPINIMDHVSTIKVNGVGTLFLCKLCNRNFLKKDVVMTHGCAKNNVPKDSFLQNHVPRPEVPKPSTVKYIKMDKDFKKPVVAEGKLAVIENKPVDKKPVAPATDCIRVNIPVRSEVKSKPKVGPASKIKLPTKESKEPAPPPKANSSEEAMNVPHTPEVSAPSVQFPGIPSLNSRYKLVPGPNNTFTLVEEASQNGAKPVKENTPPPVPPPQSKSKKKKSNVGNNTSLVGQTVTPCVVEKEPGPEVFEIDDDVEPPAPVIDRPYPVGLFQTVPHHSGIFPPNNHPQPPAFTTPAMKKQSYTIVQTGNPSKLLISTKPQPVVEEPPRKKSKKSKPDVAGLSNAGEENPSSKDSGFFTFINVDPLMQPSYVLPTDNIIQESQISTSTPASKMIVDEDNVTKYQCNMCDQKFTREKKLLTHIQFHYKKMDEEDQMRAEKTGTKRKSRKS